MTPPPPAQVQPVPYTQGEKEIVAATLIHEAGGERAEGMQAVCNVILNRAGGDPSQAARACLAPHAFSPWNAKSQSAVINKAKAHPCWSQALMTAEQALRGALPDITGGANHFYDHKRGAPPWAVKMVRTKVIGGQTFLKGK
jgi:N-acetylmuramoyl-L-alanine amidase